MPSSRRNHTREFKLQCCRQVVTGEKRPAQICREHNLSESVLLRWRKEYEARGEAAFTEKQPSGDEAFQAKIAELERFCGQLSLENRILKKVACEHALAKRHAVIERMHQEHPEISIEGLCELMGVSRSWYYERPSAEQKAQKDVELRDAIEYIVLEFPGYGYRRVTAALRREGWSVNHKRVLRVMREESLLCQIKRRFRPTTDSAHAFGTYPNLIKETELGGLDQAWIADITYVRLPSAFCYLAAILDAYSRRCVGWHLSRFIDTRLTLSALTDLCGDF